MDTYGKLPQERAMQTLIHDTNAGGYGVRWCQRNIKEFLEKEGTTKKDAVRLLTQVLAQINVSESKTKGAIDEYVKEFKQDFPDRTTGR